MVPRAHRVKPLDAVNTVNLSISLSYSRITQNFINKLKNQRRGTKPQRHRDTEKSQRTSQTRRHKGHPPHPSQFAHRSRRSRRWPFSRLEHVARSRPSSNDGRGPLDRVIAPNASVRRGGPTQRPALSKSAALASIHPLSLNEWHLPSKQERGEAEPTRPGRAGRWEARLRRTLAFGTDGLSTGGRRSSDRRLFRRQSTV